MHIHTPLLRSDWLSQESGRDVWLKLDCLQPIGSFKLRGVGHACKEYARRGARGFVSSSGGNAGLAAAYAGGKLGLPVTVVVPETTTRRAIGLIERHGAAVRVVGENWNAAHQHALSLAGDERPLIHPYDDPLLWDGHASMMDEVAEDWDGPAPDAVLVAVGGGGLLCGVYRGLERNGWLGSRVYAVETEGAASMRAALDANEVTSIPAIHSVATSLGALRVADEAFRLAQAHRAGSLIVSDAQAVRACSRFLDEHRLLVEPACGASLAPLLSGDEALRQARRILVVVCGGATVTAARLRHLEGETQTGDDQARS